MHNEILQIPFGEVIWPWIPTARQKLAEKIGEPLDLLVPEVLFALELSLVKKWSRACTPSMHFVLNLKKMSPSLVGENPRERYLNFIQTTLLDPENLRSFFEEYQTLSPTVERLSHFWVEQVAEFYFRLKSDLPLLERELNGGQPLGRVKTIQSDAGDTHHEGRSVSIVEFECGKSIVYKPKNSSIAKKFNHLLNELNQLDPGLSLKSYTVLPRGDYGWEEKVEWLPCADLSAVERYFERAGMLLSLCYKFHATDMHFENVIACGEFPVLIDLETLFHTRLRKNEAGAAQKEVFPSVLTVGLLPAFLPMKLGEKGVDLSALGKENGVAFGQRWVELNTDEINCVEQKTSPSTSSNQVLCNQQIMSAQDFIEPIVTGFNRMYRFLQKHSLFVEDAMSKMVEDQIRVVLRPTRFYGFLAHGLTRPGCVLNKEMFDETLGRVSYFNTPTNTPPDCVTQEEKLALLRGDIPCFHTFPFSSDLYVKDSLISKNCLEKISVRELTEKDQKFQERLIRLAFSAKTSSLHASGPDTVQMEGQLVLQEGDLLAYITNIATTLMDDACLSEDGSLGWIHLEPDFSMGQYQVSTIDDNLYAGKTGIALFFAALSRISGDPQWKIATECCLKPLRDTIAKNQGKSVIESLGTGGMAGVGGAIYALLNIGLILKDAHYIADAQKLLECIEPAEISADRVYDIISGSAGLLLSLLTLYRHTSNPLALELAHHCAMRLCENTWEMGFGFAHGAAGIGYALHAYAQYNSDPQYTQAAQQAFAYEATNSNSRCAWCRGAAGSGLARLAADRNDPEILKALEITKLHLFGADSTLCCGFVGGLEFLRENKEDLQSILPSILYRITQEKQEFPNPGFMQGRAGVGYTLLRLIDKERCLPQVLLLHHAAFVESSNPW